MALNVLNVGLQETALSAAARDKPNNSGIEVFTLFIQIEISCCIAF